MPSTFDTIGFYAAIDAVRKERGLTWYAVFRATYLDVVMSAAKRARPLAPRNRAILAQWAGIDGAAFEREAVRP